MRGLPLSLVSREQIMICIRDTAGPAYYKVCRTRAAPKHEAVQLRLVGVDEWMERMIDGVKEMDERVDGWSVQTQFN